jgi:hypothetical protein
MAVTPTPYPTKNVIESSRIIFSQRTVIHFSLPVYGQEDRSPF